MLLEQSGQMELARQPVSESWLQEVLDGLCDLSLRDALTGLANRRHFRAVLEREIDRVARSGESALLLMLDIDHFKRINDHYGHSAGDLVIQAVSRRLVECVRPMDTVARYGGEEFAIVLPNCLPAFGKAVAERIRRTIEAEAIQVQPHVHVHATVSIGGAFAPQWIRSSTALWIERADLQLYCAKSEGRNRVSLELQAISSVTAEEKNMLFGPLQGDGAAMVPATVDATVPSPEAWSAWLSSGDDGTQESAT